MNICSDCGVYWPPNGKSISFYFWSSGGAGSLKPRSLPGVEKTVVVPLMRRAVFPPLPASGFKSASEPASLAGAKLIEGDISPGPDPSVYAFARVTVHRNLYRIAVP